MFFISLVLIFEHTIPIYMERLSITTLIYTLNNVLEEINIDNDTNFKQ